MSKEQVFEAVKKLPAGFYTHLIRSFINGRVSTTRRGTVKMTIEIGIEQLGSPFDDVRAVLNPLDNKLVPVLLFIDPEEALRAEQKGGAA